MICLEMYILIRLLKYYTSIYTIQLLSLFLKLRVKIAPSQNGFRWNIIYVVKQKKHTHLNFKLSNSFFNLPFIFCASIGM